jgi:hypothetical protein
VKQLLALKAEFKQITGQDYKPGSPPSNAAPPCTKTTTTSTSSSSSSSPAHSGLYEQVSQQGDVLRKLKAEKAPKVCSHLPSLLSIPYQMLGSLTFVYSPFASSVVVISPLVSVANRPIGAFITYFKP